MPRCRTSMREAPAHREHAPRRTRSRCPRQRGICGNRMGPSYDYLGGWFPASGRAAAEIPSGRAETGRGHGLPGPRLVSKARPAPGSLPAEAEGVTCRIRVHAEPALAALVVDVERCRAERQDLFLRRADVRHVEVQVLLL